jgi:hypothetical protein
VSKAKEESKERTREVKGTSGFLMALSNDPNIPEQDRKIYYNLGIAMKIVGMNRFWIIVAYIVGVITALAWILPILLGG